ncbi:MAG TPA: hypothetical protein VMP08_01060, partial [Anaerolineae bacterium]|nr:hypothetical protein [Anaerolineae bacterium]
MSRYAPEITSRSWRSALLSPAIAMSVIVIVALLIASQGQAINGALNFDRLDEHWLIRSGR